LTARDAQDPEHDHQDTALPTSELLIQLVRQGTTHEMSVGELIDGMGDRAFALIFLLLALPTAIPGPPGLPVVFGIPLMIVTAQLWLGRSHPWLPPILRRRRFSRPALLGMLERARPQLARLEAVCRPRLPRLSDHKGERWIGAFFCFCTLFLVNPIPVPFSHLPLAIGLVILALGLVERDGIVIIGGLIASVAGIVINVSLVGSAVVLGTRLFHHM
jgi:hypothetical protein